MRGLGFYLEGSLASAWNPATGWLAAAGWRKGEPGAWLSIRPKEPIFTEDGSPVVLIAQRHIDRGGRRIRPGDILVVDAPIGRELVESAAAAMTQLAGQVQWAHRWEPGQTFSGVSRRDALSTQTSLTRAQLRHVPAMRSWARERYGDELRGVPREYRRRHPVRRAELPSSVITEEMRRLDRWIAERLPGDKSHGRRPLFTEAWWTFADWVYRHYGKHELNTEIAGKLAAVRDNPPDESYISRKQGEFIAAGGLRPVGRARIRRMRTMPAEKG